VVLHPLELVSVAADKLGKAVRSLAEDGQQIIDALDELITRAHG
jgi:toxin CcdB